MVHYNFRFLSVGILILIHGYATSITIGQIPAGDIDVTWIRKYSLNGCHLCAEMPLNVYGIRRFNDGNKNSEG